jgi:hypothetical protein
MPPKSIKKKKHARHPRQVKSWQLVFILFLILAIPLFVFVALQTSRSQRVLGTQTHEPINTQNSIQLAK